MKTFFVVVSRNQHFDKKVSKFRLFQFFLQDNITIIFHNYLTQYQKLPPSFACFLQCEVLAAFWPLAKTLLELKIWNIFQKKKSFVQYDEKKDPKRGFGLYCKVPVAFLQACKKLKMTDIFRKKKNCSILTRKTVQKGYLNSRNSLLAFSFAKTDHFRLTCVTHLNDVPRMRDFIHFSTYLSSV